MGKNHEVDSDLVLLMADWEHNELYLDLYGIYDRETGEVEVQDVTLTGDLRSIGCRFKKLEYNGFDWAVSRRLDAAKAAAFGEARLDAFDVDAYLKKL